MHDFPVSIHSIFIAKKVYLDILTDSSGKADYMVRGKGSTQVSIRAEPMKRGNGADAGCEQLYKAIATVRRLHLI